MLNRTVKNSKQEFDKVFLEIDHSETLSVGNKNDIRFFMLDIQNNKYCYYNKNRHHRHSSKHSFRILYINCWNI